MKTVLPRLSFGFSGRPFFGFVPSWASGLADAVRVLLRAVLGATGGAGALAAGALLAAASAEGAGGVDGAPPAPQPPTLVTNEMSARMMCRRTARA